MLLLDNCMHINVAVAAIPALHRVRVRSVSISPLPRPLACPFADASISTIFTTRVYPSPTTCISPPPVTRPHARLQRSPHIRQFNRLLFLVLVHARKPAVPRRGLRSFDPAPEAATSPPTTTTPNHRRTALTPTAVFAGPSVTAIAGGVSRDARVFRGGQFGEEGTHARERGADDTAGGLDLRPDVDACRAPGRVGARAERGDVGDADDGDGADAVCGGLVWGCDFQNRWARGQ